MRRFFSFHITHPHISKLVSIILFCMLLAGSFSNAQGATTQSVDEIKKNIDARNAQVAQLNAEIKLLDTQIQAAAKEGQTLKGSISTLDVTRNKLLKELKITQNKVSATSLTIKELGSEITDKQKKIDMSREALGSALRDMSRTEDVSLVENVLEHNSITELWNEVVTLSQFQTGLRENISTSEKLKADLAQKKSDNESQKITLVTLTGELSDQKKVVDQNKIEKENLLAATKSKEVAYQKQVEEKKKLGEAFQKEINDYESQLKLIIDPKSVPSAGKGILFWPLENVFITQYFGDTSFSKTTRAYSGKGHNGIDFRATSGTKVMAALGGVVEGTGDTGVVASCYSYGRWVLIRHDNGLTTLYAHLSLIKATVGQRVNTGDIIGYSGYTGFVYPPGPSGAHLHFGVYASQGVKIIRYSSSTPCNGATIPVADIRAYLNPILYL